VRDKRPAEHDIHIEQAFAIQRFRDLVAGLLHQALLFFRERDAFFSSDDEEAVCPVPMQEGNSEQRLRARRNQAEANGAPALLIIRGGRCSDGGGRKCPEDGLNITRSEASGGMADQRPWSRWNTAASAASTGSSLITDVKVRWRWVSGIGLLCGAVGAIRELTRIIHECRREASETEARRGFSHVRPTQAYLQSVEEAEREQPRWARGSDDVAGIHE